MKKFFWSVSLILAAAAMGYSQQVSFKLTGGLNWIDGGDYNRGIAGENAYLKETSLAMSGAYKNLKIGWNSQLEIINYLNPNLAFGLGGGYSRASIKSSVTTRRSFPDGQFDSASSYKPALSSISFFLNIHYLARLTPRLNLDVFAGPVFYICQFNFENSLQTSRLSLNQTETFSASSTALGGQGGLSLDFKISRGLALTAGGCYRNGNVSEFLGNWAVTGTSASGTIAISSAEYYLWAYEDTLGGGHSHIAMFDKNGPPAGSFSSAKKAALDLSGLSVSAGLIINF